LAVFRGLRIFHSKNVGEPIEYVMVHIPSHVAISRKWCYAVCNGITW